MTCEGQVLGDDDIHLWPESRDFLWKIKRLRPSENITEWGFTLAQPWINHQLLSLSSNPKKMHPESKMHRDNQLHQFQLHQFMCHVNGRFFTKGPTKQMYCRNEWNGTVKKQGYVQEVLPIRLNHASFLSRNFPKQLWLQDCEVHLPGHGHVGDIINCSGSRGQLSFLLAVACVQQKCSWHTHAHTLCFLRVMGDFFSKFLF